MASYRKMTCPECSKVLRPAKPVPANKKVRCPECESVFYPEDAVNPVEAVEDEPRGTGRKAAPAAKKAAAPSKPKPGDDDEGGTYAYVKEEGEDDDEPAHKVDYALDMSVKDLRGPAQAIVMSPSNKLMLSGFIGVGGWLVLLVLLLIPALFPLKPDDRVKRPVLKVKPGLSHIAPSGPVGGGGFGGGFGGGGFAPPGGGGPGGAGKAAPKIEEDKAGLYDVGGYDIAAICDLPWYFFLVALIPLFFCMAWSMTVAFGAIQIQNIQSRAWGIIGCIFAMTPIHVAGVQLVTAMVVQIVLIQVIDDIGFIQQVVMGITTIEYLLSLGVGIWALATLFKKDVVAGFEYVAE